MTIEELKEKYNVRSFTDDEWDWIKQLIDNSVETAERRVLERVREKLPKKKEQLDKTDPDNYGACYAIAGYNQAIQKVDDILKELTLEEDKWPPTTNGTG